MDQESRLFNMSPFGLLTKVDHHVSLPLRARVLIAALSLMKDGWCGSATVDVLK
jgi:hypothetical protein